MLKLRTVSEDFFNRSQSWNFVGVYRMNTGSVRVDIRANAYEGQSHARLEVWTQHGWTFHSEVPTREWYKDAPTYVKGELDERDRYLFESVRNDLLGRWADTAYGTTDFTLAEKEVTHVR